MYKFRGIGREEEVAWKGFRVSGRWQKRGGRYPPGILEDFKWFETFERLGGRKLRKILGISRVIDTTLDIFKSFDSSEFLELNANPANPSSLWMSNIFFSVFKEFA